MESNTCDLYRALNLEPPSLKRMKQMAQQRAMNGRVLQPAKKSIFPELGPKEAKVPVDSLEA